VRVQGPAVRARHPVQSKVTTECRRKRKQSDGDFPRRSAGKAGISHHKNDEENRDRDSQKGVQEGVRDVKKVRVAEGGHVSAVDY